VARGAYVLDAGAGAPAAVLMASGSEVGIALDAQAALAARGVNTRVVSVPSHELFLQQDAGYRATVLPAGVKRVAIEAAHPMSWDRLVGEGGTVIGIDTFGASAPFQVLYREYGLTVDRVVAAVVG
ncbi:MAG: transketolase, partial [Gemmatimonadetes bacterium]|nr:transketolase [Gemmatimonadota bacterium]